MCDDRFVSKTLTKGERTVVVFRFLHQKISFGYQVVSISEEKFKVHIFGHPSLLQYHGTRYLLP